MRLLERKVRTLSGKSRRSPSSSSDSDSSLVSESSRSPSLRLEKPSSKCLKNQSYQHQADCVWEALDQAKKVRKHLTKKNFKKVNNVLKGLENGLKE